MFDIRPMPLQIADPLRDRLLRVETATLEEICGQALAMQAREPLTLARLRAGELLGDISGANQLIRGRSC
jgi:hypothetical protein